MSKTAVSGTAELHAHEAILDGLWRRSVPGGWIYYSRYGEHVTATFVPGPSSAWAPTPTASSAVVAEVDRWRAKDVRDLAATVRGLRQALADARALHASRGAHRPGWRTLIDQADALLARVRA